MPPVSCNGWVKVASGCGALTLPKRDHLGTFEAEPSRGYGLYQPVLARHGDKTPVGQQHAEQGLSVLRHEGVEIDERGNFLRHAVSDAADHHAAIGMADENDIGQICVVDNANHVLNMRVEIDLTAEEVLSGADTGQRRSVGAAATPPASIISTWRG